MAFFEACGWALSAYELIFTEKGVIMTECYNHSQSQGVKPWIQVSIGHEGHESLWPARWAWPCWLAGAVAAAFSAADWYSNRKASMFSLVAAREGPCSPIAAGIDGRHLRKRNVALVPSLHLQDQDTRHNKTQPLLYPNSAPSANRMVAAAQSFFDARWISDPIE